MDEAQSLTKSSEQEIEDCCDYFKRHEVGEDVYRNKANGDDAGYENVEEIEGENDE